MSRGQDGRERRVGQVGLKTRAALVGSALLLAYAASDLRLSVLAQQQPPSKPSFQSSVEVTSLDVNVVDD